MKPGSNVYAELGSTWRFLMRDPEQAAHALGKLIRSCGPNNVLWGTDSIWYGSPQDQIQAFRTFQISPALRERHGYPEITPALRAKIFGLNAARVYGLTPGRGQEVHRRRRGGAAARRPTSSAPTRTSRPMGRRRGASSSPCCARAAFSRIGRTMLYDLLLRGGRVIDPSQNLDGAYDVAIREDRVAAVLPSIAPSSAKETLDVSGKLVLPGLIDTHAHVFQYVTGRFGLEADLCGVRSGVTTLVDQGGPSCMTLPAFREFVVNAKKSRVVAFLSAYLVGGMEGHYYPSLYRPDCVDVDATVKAANENRDIVKGFKAHAELGGFARWGIEVMRLSAEIGRQANLPVYIHFGQLWDLPESGANGVDPDTHPRAGGAAPQARRHPRASLHAPSRRLREPRRQGASGRQGSARARAQDRRRARLALQLSDGAHRARCRHRAGHAGRRHAWLQHSRSHTRGERRTSTPTRSTCSSARRASRSSRR